MDKKLPVKMVKNIQTNTFLGSVFDEEHAGSHNFAHNLLHHRHFDVQKNCTTVALRRMQHFGQNKKDFGIFSQNPPVTCFVIRIRK